MINATSPVGYPSYLASILNNTRIYNTKTTDTFDKSHHYLDDGTEVQIVEANIPIKDNSDNNHCAKIAQNSNGADKFYLMKDDKVLCWMKLHDNGKEIVIDKLYSKQDAKDYKGCGSALLKYAVKRSIQAGYNGAVSLLVAGSAPFYYKNNLRISNTHPKKAEIESALDYCARTGFPISKILKQEDCYGFTMNLDTTDAKALLDNHRKYKVQNHPNRSYKKDVKLGDDKLSAIFDLCRIDSKYVFQIIDSKAQKDARLAYCVFSNKDKRLKIEQMKINAPYPNELEKELIGEIDLLNP